MTFQTSISRFMPQNYQVFSGLDVDKGSIAVTFSDHNRLINSLRLPYSSEQLLNYVRKHFPQQQVAFVYEAGPTGFGLYDDITREGHPCLVVAPSMVPTAPGNASTPYFMRRLGERPANVAFVIRGILGERN